AENRLLIADVLLREGVINARRGKDGDIDWQQLAAAFSTGATEASPETNAESATTSAPLNFSINRVQLEQWQANYEDEAFRHPLKLAIKEIGLGFSVANPDGAVEIQALNTKAGGLSLQSALYPQPIATLAG